MYTLAEFSNKESYTINKTHPLVHGKGARIFSTAVGAGAGAVASGLVKNRYGKAALIGAGGLLGATKYHKFRQNAYAKTRKRYNGK